MNIIEQPASAKPFVVGLGGTTRAASTTDRALNLVLAAAEEAGARTRTFDGPYLAGLPLYRPDSRERSPEAEEFLDAIRLADGLIVATPSYHAAVSGLVKNALDYLEDLRDDWRPYLEGRAVGCVVTAAGWQACGTTLTSLRSIVHALRGWPTPLGVTLNTSERPLDPADPANAATLALATVGYQVVEFVRGQGRVTNPGPGPQLPTGRTACETRLP